MDGARAHLRLRLKDSIRDRSATSFAYVVRRVSTEPPPKMIEWEHDMNRLVGQSFTSSQSEPHGDEMTGRTLVLACTSRPSRAFSSRRRRRRTRYHALYGDRYPKRGCRREIPTVSGPSSIVPPQKLTIRFNRKKHVKEVGATCVTCH
jgi:hypothetical protein